jgi:anti-sigma regulatory factor (Ser/Thr protein kinase)
MGTGTERVVSDTPAPTSREQLEKAAARDRSTTTRTTAALPRPAEAEWLSVLQGGVGAPRRARNEIASQLNGELAATRRADFVLLVGELVANSVVHANADEADEIVMELVIDPDFVRVAVTDRGSSSVPTVHPKTSVREGGRGLFLVEQLSDRWGITRDGTQRTQVWFEMAREHQGPT